MNTIKPLVTLEHAGVTEPILGMPATGRGLLARTLPAVFHVICRDCGNVTRTESGGTVNDAPLAQAALYRQRHLAKHLQVLAQEIASEV